MKRDYPHALLFFIFLLLAFACPSFADTFIRMESEAGDSIGNGENIALTTIDASGSNDYSAISFHSGFYSFNFQAKGRVLTTGEYKKLTFYDYNNYLNISIFPRNCGAITGKFIVHEIQFGSDNTIQYAAIDFVQYCVQGSPLYGYIRFNSSIPILDADNDQIPDIKDNCPDVFNADQQDTDRDGLGNVCDNKEGVSYIYFESQKSVWIRAGFSQFVAPPNNPNIVFPRGYVSSRSMEMSAGGYQIRFQAPQNESLHVGVYEVNRNAPYDTNPTFNVSGNGMGCGTSPNGRFEIFELERSEDGLIKNFSANLTFYCYTSEAPLFAIIRYNSELDNLMDYDSDGITDSADNCPLIGNVDQLDKDNDRRGDICDVTPRGDDEDKDGVLVDKDNCPYVANNDQKDFDYDFIGDVCDATPVGPDDDRDLISNMTDNCRYIANPMQLDTDGDGEGNLCDSTPYGPDEDLDEILDTKDNCTYVKNKNQRDSDYDGVGDACDSVPKSPYAKLNGKIRVALKVKECDASRINRSFPYKLTLDESDLRGLGILEGKKRIPFVPGNTTALQRFLSTQSHCELKLTPKNMLMTLNKYNTRGEMDLRYKVTGTRTEKGKKIPVKGEYSVTGNIPFKIYNWK